MNSLVLLASRISISEALVCAVVLLFKLDPERECRANPKLRFKHQVSPEFACQLLRNMQSQAYSFHIQLLCGVNKPKQLEYFVLVLIPNANTVVLDRYSDVAKLCSMIRLVLASNDDTSVSGSELKSIGQQVHQYLLNSLLV